MKGLDTAIATRISAGDTIIKVVDLLCRCVDSGNTQALYCMDKNVLVNVQHHAWTKVGFTLLCTVTQKGLRSVQRRKMTGILGPVTVLDLARTPLTSCSARKSEIQPNVPVTSSSAKWFRH